MMPRVQRRLRIGAAAALLCGATSTFALNSVTLPFTLALADKGWRKALEQDPHLREGLNVCEGKLTCEPVAEAHGLPYTSAESVLGL